MPYNDGDDKSSTLFKPENVKGRNGFGDQGVDESAALKWIGKK
jgi:hypothetical protein